MTPPARPFDAISTWIVHILIRRTVSNNKRPPWRNWLARLTVIGQLFDGIRRLNLLGMNYVRHLEPTIRLLARLIRSGK
jgi:hypothetical protein